MEKNRRDMKLFPINWSKLLLIASLSMLIAMLGCGGDSGGDDDDEGGGGGGSEYSLSLGTWSGDDISFTVTEGSYYVNNLSVTYRGYADGTICNYNYEVTSTLGTRIQVTNNTFSYEDSSLTISGEFLSETSVEVDISWSSFDTTCNATESGNALLVANSDSGGNGVEDSDDDDDDSDLITWYEDSDGDGYGDPQSTDEAELQPVGYVANSTDCDDTNQNIYPGAVEVECDGIDQDCDGSDLCSAFQITEARWTGEGDKFSFGFTVEGGEITSSTILVNNPAPGIAYTIAGWGGAEITNNTFFFMDYVNNYGNVTVNGTFTSASTCTLEVNHETFEAIPSVP